MNGANVNTTDNRKRTALHYIAIKGGLLVVKTKLLYRNSEIVSRLHFFLFGKAIFEDVDGLNSEMRKLLFNLLKVQNWFKIGFFNKYVELKLMTNTNDLFSSDFAIVGRNGRKYLTFLLFSWE